MKIDIKFIDNDFVIMFGKNKYHFYHEEDRPYMIPEIIRYNMTGIVEEFNRMDNDVIFKKIESNPDRHVYMTFGIPRYIPRKIEDFRLFNEFVFSKYFELYDYYVYDVGSDVPALDAFQKTLEIILDTILKSDQDDEIC